MTFSLVYPTTGRGNFATNAQLGGTLNPKGTGPGPYYRAPASRKFADMPGSRGLLAVRSQTTCDINDYAVYMAVRALQRKIGVQDDGAFGDDSDKATRTYQVNHGLYVDGVIGPKTCKLMYDPWIIAAVKALNRNHETSMLWMSKGHMWVESGCDPGAVGETTPKDLGPGLNGDHNPEMSADYRLTPETAIPAMVKIVDGNIYALRFDIDAATLSYNIGRGGAATWVRNGRPTWGYTYINKVKAGALI